MRHLKREIWPHCVTVDVDDTRMKMDSVNDWLATNVGWFRTHWHAVYKYDRTDFYFKQQADATMFALRWA